ncbi:hypothetical protein D9V34_06765 [Mycetocola lacteus]|uniref:Lipoprotein n=1 Tax=Mycetocola lacteus TaxID=76637 RepID=A0A3L7AS50_9MICO|nr:hypothetical protein D9V34_06765 [Mycetocola lacteus]
MGWNAKSVKSLGVSAILVAALSLTGCVPNADPYPEIPRFAKSGGQTQAELDAKLSSLEGLNFTEAAGSKPNVKGNTGFGFRFEMDPAYRITDPVALVDFLVESAWSVRDGYMPNTTVAIRFTGDPLDQIDLVTVGEDAGWVPPGAQTKFGVDESGHTSLNVWLTNTQARDSEKGGPVNRERLGKWPGDAPDVPENLVVPR